MRVFAMVEPSIPSTIWKFMQLSLGEWAMVYQPSQSLGNG
jgi:hypothetical protein